MAISLTPEEQKTVNDKKVSEDSLPTYFNSQFKSDVKITRDFETFLILASRDMKTSAISWIEKAIGIQSKNELRDKLLLRASEQEAANAKKKMDALDQTLADFSTFRETFVTQLQFADVSEVQLFLNDLQRVIEELVVSRERAYFDQVSAGVLNRHEDNVSVTKDQVEQLQSWTPILSQYL